MIPFVAPTFGRQQGDPLRVANPNYYRTAFMIDASDKSDGTGYNVEESRHARTLTYSGNATVLSNKFELDGVGDLLSLAHSFLWTPGSKFTLGLMGLVVDAYNAGSSAGLIGQYSADSGAIGWNLTVGSAGELSFSWSNNATSTTHGLTIGGAGTIALATEYDIFVCWDGANIYTLVNGVPMASVAYTGLWGDADQGIRFGALANGGVAERFLNGRFTAAFLTRGECLFPNDGNNYESPSLPLTLDSPALVDPYWADVICVIGYDSDMNRIRDFGPYDWKVNVAGNAAGTLAQTLADGTPSIAFDGSGDYLTLPADDSFLEPGAPPLTVEGFFRHTSLVAANDLITKYTASGNQRCILMNATSTNALSTAISSNGSTNTTFPATATIAGSTGVWEHKAICLDGTNARGFVDGVQNGSNTAWTASLFNAAAHWAFGTRGGGGNDLNGHGTQFRITNAARYTAGFTPPTGAFPLG